MISKQPDCHGYLGLPPGLDLKRRIIAKFNAPELLRRELANRSYKVELIELGANTDAYQPREHELRLARRLLEILHECEYPLGLISKSSLVERDMDLLAARQLVVVTVSITNLDHRTARTMEPRATAPARVFALSSACAPTVNHILLRVPWEVGPLFQQWLEAHYPERAGRIMSRIRDIRGGNDYGEKGPKLFCLRLR